VNLVGPFLLSRSVVPHMLRQGIGRLLMVSSSFGEFAIPRASAYSAARAGINHFTRVLAAELLSSGVTANVVFPGIVETDGLHRFREKMHDQDHAVLSRGVRPRHPSEAARLLLWLCGPSTFRMTGQIVSMEDPVVQHGMAHFLHHYGE
jgi:3-oxoacyl-[acyl-carrier protein] reductase